MKTFSAEYAIAINEAISAVDRTLEDFAKKNPDDVYPWYPCGFASVHVKPANSAFAKWAVAQGLARKDTYLGGICFWISDYGQSMTLKGIHARTMADSLARQLGIHVFSQSRMD